MNTVQPEEVVWVAVAGYAIVVHFLAQREAGKDEREAKHNHSHLPPRTRANAHFLAHTRKLTERAFLLAQSFFAAAGVRGLFLVPSNDRSRGGTIIAVGLLVAGELCLVYASNRSSIARHKVRTGTAPSP